MFGLFGVLFLIGFIAVLSIGFSFLLSTIWPEASWRKRVVGAALASAFVPVSLPLFTLALEIGFGTEGLIAMSGIVVLAVILAAIVGYPVAYFFTKRREKRPDPSTFE